MSKLYDFRQELATAIAAEDLGFTSDNIILKRQTDLWNDIATAINTSDNGVVLHIGVASGKSTEENSLEMEVTVPITIIALPELIEGATPEEDIWEALVTFLHDFRFTLSAYAYRLRFESFEDIEIDADGGTQYLGRQTIFAKHLSI